MENLGFQYGKMIEVSPLGSGGFGEVFRISFNCEDYTLKWAYNSIGHDIIQEEIKILKLISGSKYFPQLVETFPNGFLTEYIPGETLYHLISPSWPNSEELKEVAISVLKGLDYLHNSGIVHRDIKPKNIIYDPETRRVKIIDFGLATQTPRVVWGSKINLSKELYDLKRFKKPLTLEAFKRGDVFGLGITLYFMVQGEYPFETNNYGYYEYEDFLEYSDHPDDPVKLIINQMILTPKFAQEYLDLFLAI